MTKSPQDELTVAPSPSSPRQMSLDMDSGTSLPASEGGLMRSDSQESQTMPTSGLAPVPVSRSATRARGKEFSTLDIFGQHGSHSSRSVGLQSSLESRLRAGMASGGSTLFSLTWNDAVTPSGRRICALRASARRTQDSGCTSWPTPTVSRGDYSYAHGNHETPTLKLAGAAKTANWPTPTSRDWKSSASNKHLDNARPLNEVARLAAWPTPVSGDANGGGAPSYAHGGKDLKNTVKTAAWPTARASNGAGTIEPKPRASGTKAQFTLQHAVALAHWATPTATELGNSLESYIRMKANMKSGKRTSITHLTHQAQLAASGRMPSGSSAETRPEAPRSPGQLNPDHSRWLMGYPRAWAELAPASSSRSQGK